MDEKTPAPPAAPHLRYEQVAESLARQIEQGVYQAGDRLPGVRRLAQYFDVSVSTVIEACRLLEDRSLLETRARSGHYVRAVPTDTPGMDPQNDADPPALVTDQALSLTIAQAGLDPRILQLGAAEPPPHLMPLQGLRRSIHNVLRAQAEAAFGYDFPPGAEAMRVQIAQRMIAAGCTIAPEDVVLTTGCQEAMRLALQCVAGPGDVVAIETPTFYGILQLIESMGMQALEIPTDAMVGLDLNALERALQRWPVKAIIAMPNFGNPLGHLMPEGNKSDLVAMLARHRVPLIENDVFGDLAHDGKRPRAAWAYDQGNWVIYCSSFSKTLGPGLRAGWMIPGRFRDRSAHLKFASTLASPSLEPLALADFLARGGYVRYLRRIQRSYERQVLRMARAVQTHFPPGTRTTKPRGGFVLWVELPPERDSVELYHRALAEGIGIAPGPVFSAHGRFGRYLRLSCTPRWDQRTSAAIARLGRLAGGPRGGLI